MRKLRDSNLSYLSKDKKVYKINAIEQVAKYV